MSQLVTPTSTTTQAPTAWRAAWAECHADQMAHPNYDSGVREAARAIKCRLADTHAIPVAWLEQFASAWERGVSVPERGYLGGYPQSYYAEGASYTRAFLARWAPTSQD